MLFFVTAYLHYKSNCVCMCVYHKGQIVGQYQVPIQGLDFRDRKPAVIESAMWDIVRNKLIEWAKYNEAFDHGANPEVPVDYPFEGKTGPLFYNFTPENTRITIRMED